MKQKIGLTNGSVLKTAIYKLTIIAAFALSTVSTVYAEENQDIQSSTIQVSMLTLETTADQRKEAENIFEDKSTTYVSKALCE